MSTERTIGLQTALAVAATLSAMSALPASAQGPKPAAKSASGSPAAPPVSASAAAAGPAAGAAPSAAATPAGKTITLNYTRPGAYDYWTIGKSGPGAILTASPGAKSVPVTVPTDATAIDVLDDGSGLVASLDIAKAQGDNLTVSPNDFTLLRTVKVTVTGKNGQPVEKAQVTLTDANGKTSSKVLTADDAGVVQFNDIPLGKATIAAAYAATNVKTSNDVTLAPNKGGGPVPVTVSLSGDVPTVVAAASASPAAAPAPTVVVAQAPAPPAEPASNNWFAGVFGVTALVVLGFFGLRAARARGITVESALKEIGVDTTNPSPTAGLAPPKPVPTPLPPLPSLSDLPSAGPASKAAVAFGGGAPATAVAGPPRITGIAGPVSGESFELDATAPLTIGRDVANTLSLAQDTGVSRKHARFERISSGWQVVDNGSSNGTFVNGARVGVTPQTLRAGDEIQIGGSRFRFEGG